MMKMRFSAQAAVLKTTLAQQSAAKTVRIVQPPHGLKEIASQRTQCAAKS